MTYATDALKGGPGGDAVDKEETFAIADPLITESGVLFLSGGVEDFEDARLVIDDDLLPVRIFDGGVVCLNKVAQAELNSQSGLANATISENHQAVQHLFSQKTNVSNGRWPTAMRTI